MDEQKSNSTAIVAILAVAVVLIVAMMCATVAWIATRMQPQPVVVTMDEGRRAVTPHAEATPVHAPAVAAPEEKPAPAPEAKAVVKPEVKPEVAPEVKPEPQPVPAPVKKAPPKELPTAKVGPDGLPMDRVTLPTQGLGDVEWQF